MLTAETFSILDKASKSLDEEAFCDIYGDDEGSQLFGMFEWDFDQNLVQFVTGLRMDLKVKLIEHLNARYFATHQ
jgi:hypothetical protein